MFKRAINIYNYLIFFSLLAIFGVSSAMAGGGFLDKGFANKGKMVPALPNSTEKAYDAAVQADGKIVVVGNILAAGTGAAYDFYIARYNPDGTIDTNFGNNGQKIVSLGGQFDSDTATSVAIQADGKIVVAGSAQVPATVSEFGIVRLFPSGELDPTFGQAGIKRITISNTGSGVSGMALQMIDGQQKIVLAGFAHGQATPVMAFARLDSAGQLDQNFGTGGIKLVPSTSPIEYAYAVTIQNIEGENKIIGAGYSRFSLGSGSYRDDYAVVRLNSNGTMDAGFGTEGKIRTQMSATSGARGVVVQRIGETAKIVVGGYTYRTGGSDFSLARYTIDGVLDTTFGTQGRAYADMVGREDQIQELLVQPDGKLIGIGWTHTLPGWGQDFAIARFNENGSLDKSFGACGKTITNLGSNTDIAYGGVLQPDGKIIVVGEFQSTPSSTDISIARFGITGGGASATARDFDGDGADDIAVFRPSSGGWYMNCSCEGVKGENFGMAGDLPVAADYDGDGYTDQAVYRAGTWYIKRSSDGGVTISQFGMAEDIPTVGDYDGDDKADISIWRQSIGAWYVLMSSTGEYWAKSFGQDGDRPVQDDYDNDGRTDLAIYRAGTWWTAKSSEDFGNFYAYHFGAAEDVPLKGDFDGDGKADYAVYRRSEGNWYQQLSKDGFKAVRFGDASDHPVPADYNGDGKADVAVYRSGNWYLQNTAAGQGGYKIISFGLATDVPVSYR